MKPTVKSTTFWTTKNSTTTQIPTHPTSDPNESLSGFGIAVLIIVIIVLVALVIGNGFHIYRKRANNEPQYSPL